MNELMTLAGEARALQIAAPAAAQAAADLRRRLKEGIAALKDRYEAEKRPLMEELASIRQAEKLALAAPLDALEWLDGGLRAWGERLAEERAEQDRQAHLEAEAERARLQALADAEAVRMASLRRDAEAERLFEGGQTAEAVALVNAPAPIAVAAPVPAVRIVHAAPPPAPPAGVSYRTTWRAEVTDMPAFLAWAAGDPTRHVFALANGPALNALARASKCSGAAPPGIKFTSEQGVASR